MKNKNTNAKKIINFSICFMLMTISIFFFNFNKKDVNATDGVDVSSKLTNIKINISTLSNNTPIVNDNIPTGAAIYLNTAYTMKISWDIPESDFYNQVHAGDFFTLDISGDVFNFTDTSLTNNLIYEGSVIGQWGIKDNKIICAFTEAAESSLKSSGYFTADGTCISILQNTQKITIAGTEIDLNINPTYSGFTHENDLPISFGLGTIEKYGTNLKGSDTIYWDILVNYNNAENFFTYYNDIFMKNIVIKDELPNDLLVDYLKITVPIFYPKNATTLTSVTAGAIDVTSQFTMVNQTEEQTKEEWEAIIRNSTQTYGFSLDKKIILINVGNLPDTISMADSSEAFEAALNAGCASLTQDELIALSNIYRVYVNPNTPYPARYLDIAVATSTASGTFQYDTYNNTASLTSDNHNNVVKGSSGDIAISKLDGGINIISPKTVVLTKKDADTGITISGASFLLQKYSENTKAWDTYTPATGETVRTTDAKGQLAYNGLDSGTYRFIEVTAAAGYDLSSAIYSVDTFTIQDTDNNGVSISVTNSKTTTSTEASTEVTTSTTEATTSTSNKDSSVPLTGDSTSILLLISILALSLSSLGFIKYKK